MLGDFVAAFDQTGNEQVFVVGITEDDASAIGGRNHANTFALLFVAYRRIFPQLGGGLLGGLDAGAADGEIGIVGSAASGGASGAVAAESPEAAAAGDAAERKDGAVVAVGREFF